MSQAIKPVPCHCGKEPQETRLVDTQGICQGVAMLCCDEHRELAVRNSAIPKDDNPWWHAIQAWNKHAANGFVTAS